MSHGSVDPVEVRSKVRKKPIAQAPRTKKNKKSHKRVLPTATSSSIQYPEQSTIAMTNQTPLTRLESTGALTVHIPFVRLPLNCDEIPAFCYDDAAPEPEETEIKDFLLTDFTDSAKNRLINLQFHFNLQGQPGSGLSHELTLQLQNKLLPLFQNQQMLISLFDALPELITQLVIKKWHRILLKNLKNFATAQYYIVLDCSYEKEIILHLKSSRTETIATMRFKSEDINANDKFIMHLIHCGDDLKNKENTLLITTQGHACRTNFILHETVQAAANSLWQKDSISTTCLIKEGSELLQNAKVNPLLDLQLEFVKNKYKKTIAAYIEDRNTHSSTISKEKIIKAKKLLARIDQAQTGEQLKLIIAPHKLQKVLIPYKRTLFWGLFKVGRALLYEQLCKMFQETEIQLAKPYLDLTLAKAEFNKIIINYINACQSQPSKLKKQNADKAKALLNLITHAKNSTQLKMLIMPVNLQQTLIPYKDTFLGRLFKYGTDPLYRQLCNELQSTHQKLSMESTVKNNLDNLALLEAKEQYNNKLHHYTTTLTMQENALAKLTTISTELQHQQTLLNQRYQTILDEIKSHDLENSISDSLYSKNDLQIDHRLQDYQIILKNLSLEFMHLQSVTQEKLNHFDTNAELKPLCEEIYLSQVTSSRDQKDPFYKQHTALIKNHQSIATEHAKLSAALKDYPTKLNQLNKKIKEVFLLLTLNKTVANAIKLQETKAQLETSFKGYCPLQLNLAINYYKAALKKYNKQQDLNFFVTSTNEKLQTFVSQCLINESDMQKYYDKHQQLRKQKFQTALTEIKEGWLKMQNQLKTCQAQAQKKPLPNQLPKLINFLELLKTLSHLGEKLARFACYRDEGEIDFEPVNQYFNTRNTASTSRELLGATLAHLCKSDSNDTFLFELLRNDWENIKEYGQELLQPPSSTANSPYHYFANSTDVHSAPVQPTTRPTSPPLITLR